MTINCLPVTSKPIENTPEHLAWEAWIMLPPPAERQRKIMPKSIFVLPSNINNSNNNKNNDQELPIPQPQIQCPPGHKLEQTKCIPVISINRDQILLDQLTNLLPVSLKPEDDYDDYDYDYSNGGDTFNYDLIQQQLPLITSNPNIFRDAETNSQPLKINFSLDKLVISNPKDDDKKPDLENDKPDDMLMEVSNDDNKSSEEIKLQPFRDQDTSPSNFDLSTTTVDFKKSESITSTESYTIEKEIEVKNETITTEQESTANTKYESTTSTNKDDTEKISESSNIDKSSTTTEYNTKFESTTSISEGSSTASNNYNIPTSTEKLHDDTMELSSIDKDSYVSTTISSTIDTSSLVSLLTPIENEFNSEIITSTENDNSTIPTFHEDEEGSSSFTLENSSEESSSDYPTVITIKDEYTTNYPDDSSIESSTNLNTIEKSSTENPIIFSSTTPSSKKDEKIEHKIIHVDRRKNQPTTISISDSHPIDWHEDREPLMESIESSNRFVYHHLGSTPQFDQQLPLTKKPVDFITSSSTTEKPTTYNPQIDINEQLRLINMIVEENKKRAAQNLKVRFPEDERTISSTEEQQSQQTKSYIRFPTETKQYTSTPYKFASTTYYQPQQYQQQQPDQQQQQSQNTQFNPEKLIFHRRFFQHQFQTSTTTPSPFPSSSSLGEIGTQKPFWWLPSGWEMDQSGDRPMLIRFWSRSPSSKSAEHFDEQPFQTKQQYQTSNIHHIITNPKTQSRTTTSRYRENSKSPTENLFREVPSLQQHDSNVNHNNYKVISAARQWKYNER